MSHSPLPWQGRGQGEGFRRTLSDAVNDNPSPQSSPLHEGKRRIYPSRRWSLGAVLLAGGESRRMGTDKATFLFRGKPLWQVQLETLRRLRPAEIFLSARTDPSWRPNDVQFIADIPPSCGPLGGLASSLAKNRQAAATSEAEPGRFVGVALPARISSALDEAVAIQPGSTALQVILRLAFSIAVVRVRPVMAALAEE